VDRDRQAEPVDGLDEVDVSLGWVGELVARDVEADELGAVALGERDRAHA
jgi:hypothetical protein